MSDSLENNNLTRVKNGLKESMSNINKTLSKIKNWNELNYYQEEYIEDIILKTTKTIKSDYSKCSIYIFVFCGALSCLIQLIGVQSCIIILNSLFDEIVAALKLLFNKNKREYNFYQILEINTYREIPEIDIAMITSSIGLIFLKNFGFVCTNISFQLFPSIWILLLFLLFEFHTGDKLLENYTGIEILILVLSYIFLSFLVGCSSAISLKEFTDIIYDVYKKSQNKGDGENLFFYLFSGISALVIILINRAIFIYFDKETSKWILTWIVIISFISFGLSIIFYGLFLIPIKNQKEIPENNSFNKSENLNETNDNLAEKVLKKNNISKINKEISLFKINNSFPNVKVKPVNKNVKKGKKYLDEIKSTKILTLCGYIYISEKTRKKSSCICYYYTNKCSWIKQTFCIADNIIFILLQLYIQVCGIGFFPILKEKLLKEFNYNKIIKFYISLFIISIFFGIVITYKSIKKIEIIERGKKIKSKKYINKISTFYANYIYIFYLGFVLFTFISSIFYYDTNSLNKERWNNIIMAEIIYFKVIDFHILTLIIFIDGASYGGKVALILITAEKLLWMIFETFIDNIIKNLKYLVIVQIIVTSIGLLFIITVYIIGIIKYFKKS